jgi:hypothetical protein
MKMRIARNEEFACVYWKQTWAIVKYIPIEFGMVDDIFWIGYLDSNS